MCCPDKPTYYHFLYFTLYPAWSLLCFCRKSYSHIWVLVLIIEVFIFIDSVDSLFFKPIDLTIRRHTDTHMCARVRAHTHIMHNTILSDRKQKPSFITVWKSRQETTVRTSRPKSVGNVVAEPGDNEGGTSFPSRVESTQEMNKMESSRKRTVRKLINDLKANAKRSSRR